MAENEYDHNIRVRDEDGEVVIDAEDEESLELRLGPNTAARFAYAVLRASNDAREQ